MNANIRLAAVLRCDNELLLGNGVLALRRVRRRRRAVGAGRGAESLDLQLPVYEIVGHVPISSSSELEDLIYLLL